MLQHLHPDHTDDYMGVYLHTNSSHCILKIIIFYDIFVIAHFFGEKDIQDDLGKPYSEISEPLD